MWSLEKRRRGITRFDHFGKNGPIRTGKRGSNGLSMSYGAAVSALRKICRELMQGTMFVIMDYGDIDLRHGVVVRCSTMPVRRHASPFPGSKTKFPRRNVLNGQVRVVLRTSYLIRTSLDNRKDQATTSEIQDIFAMIAGFQELYTVRTSRIR